MKYTIETTNNGCIETIELTNGKKFQKRNERTYFGYRALDDEFNEQMESDGIDNEEFLEKVFDLFDGFNAINFIELSEIESSL